MKISRIGVLVLLVVLGSAVAFGDSVNDPKIIIRGASSNVPAALTSSEGSMPVPGMNFTFGVPADGNVQQFFTNASGKNWTSLTLIENGKVPAIGITCDQNLFLTCTAKTLKNGNVAIVLSGGKGESVASGIGNGQTFFIQFPVVCPNGNGNCWPAGLDFTAHAHVGAVPEPSTVALMMTGLALLVSRRRLWKNRRNS